ncbi:GIY-YIG nuclease family protein [Nitrospina watsonii]|uniref:Excinuclease ABC, C subunit-like n=1 Tax=Nitrospina watsonii TaxID=1323948 RepID=A0ABM9HB82_9BACT|nr:GIY-YIG nuclease family protein [Nitrospina watsonii]CAI2717376.1 Excinuclease ABC, C subunit-like [Nitrospina watsonii]
MKTYYVYILTNRSGTLYTGMTNDLQRRVWEHKFSDVPGFSKKYKLDRLLYFEQTENVSAAIEREKQIKGWKRTKKLELIEAMNPMWEDLSWDWFETNR